MAVPPLASIDWPATITAGKDVIIGLAAIATASVAVAGLRRWRLELEGKAHFEAARALARATYKMREAISAVRSPVTFGHEFPESYNTLSVKDPKAEADAWAHVYQNRWNSHLAPAIEDFDAQSLEAEALWGEDARQKTLALRKCLGTLRAHIQAYVHNKGAGGADFRSSPDFGRRVEETIWGIGDVENPFDKQVTAAVTAIETLLRPHLRR